MAEPLIRYKDVEVHQQDLCVLNEVNLELQKGEFVYLIGKVGSGKTSLLKTLYGELDITAGEAMVLGYDMSRIKRKHIPQLRRKLGIVFQDFQLLTDRTVNDNLAFVLKATGWKNKSEIKDRIAEVLMQVGMGNKGYKFPNELSGGEQQRIVIARAMLNSPEIILADEPTGNLDAETGRAIVGLLHNISRTGGSLVLMTTHNLHLLHEFPGQVYRCAGHQITDVTSEYSNVMPTVEETNNNIESFNTGTKMKVLKFGGTSVGSAARIKEVAKLITDGEQKIVVLSAMSGTTNTLVEISDYLYKKNPEGANEIINKLEAKYKQHVNELYSTPEYKQKGQELIKSHFDYIRSYTKDLFTLFEEKVVLAQGELISTAMMNYYLQECGVKSILLPALEYMRTDKNAEPDPVYIKEKLQMQLELHPGAEIYITQGYICRNAYGEIDNLQRGGSDYTASLIGAAINASEIQIWTDIDGMHNNDPRIVDKTAPVRHLHFEEAAELAYFGAKILHPTCIQPAKYANIPVRLLNTMDPTAPGTMISNDTEKGKIKAVAAKDNITAIKIKSSRMLLAHGFLRKVFEIFESYQTSIDMICTSEVGVSVSVDNTKHLNEILDDLKKYGTVTVDKDMCIVCVVGDLEWENVGFEAKALDAMRDIPVRMISFGGSNYNISFLIRECDKNKALQSLSDALFNEE